MQTFIFTGGFRDYSALGKMASSRRYAGQQFNRGDTRPISYERLDEIHLTGSTSFFLIGGRKQIAGDLADLGDDAVTFGNDGPYYAFVKTKNHAFSKTFTVVQVASQLSGADHADLNSNSTRLIHHHPTRRDVKMSELLDVLTDQQLGPSLLKEYEGVLEI